MELDGRVALVTGAGRRIGQAIALSLGSAGARVAVHYNASAEGAEQTVKLIQASGGEARAIGADLSRAQAPRELIAAVVDAFGGLDALVNSAAIMERTPFGEVEPESWDTMFAINLRAPFFLAQEAAPHLGANGGAIVNIADLAAFETWPAYVPHGITKAGVVQMTRALARVMAPRVRVNGVAPGAVLLPVDWSGGDATHLAETTPLGRIGSSDDVVSAVRYLLAAEYVTGETIIVDGGRHVRT